MGLLTPGHWHNTHYPSNHWHNTHWPDYGIAYVTPTCRIINIFSENRIITILDENRIATVSLENRTVITTCH